MKKNNRGFTLAELLIVVAIIAVLVAVAIPVFTGSLNKAKEATDVANARAMYGQLIADYLDNNTIDSKMGLTTNPNDTSISKTDGGKFSVYVKDSGGETKYDFSDICTYLTVSSGKPSITYKNSVSYSSGITFN